MQKSFALLRATLDSAAEGILVVDERGKISNFNESFVQMWRVPEEITATRDEDRLLAFLLESVEDSGDFAKKVMGLHSKRDLETSGAVKLARPTMTSIVCSIACPIASYFGGWRTASALASSR